MKFYEKIRENLIITYIHLKFNDIKVDKNYIKQLPVVIFGESPKT